MEDVKQQCHNTLKVVEEGCRRAYTTRNSQEVEKWLRIVQCNIKLLTKKLKSKIHVNMYNCIANAVMLLMRHESLLNKLKQDLTTAAVRGAGMTARDVRPRRQLPHAADAVPSTSQSNAADAVPSTSQSNADAVPSTSRSNDDSLEQRVEWRDLDSAFQHRIRTGVVVNLVHKDLIEFLDDSRQMFVDRAQTALQNNENLKVNAVLRCNFVKQDDDTEDVKHFQIKNFIVLPATDLTEAFNTNIRDKLLHEVEEFEREKSGWSLIEVLNVNLNFNKYVPFGGSCSTFVEVPEFIKNKRAVINIRNEDHYCFLWSVIAALYPAKSNKNNIYSYLRFKNVLKYDDKDFPMTLHNIKKFEKMNDLSINVYGLENNDIGDDEDDEKEPQIVTVLYLSQHKSPKDTIHLLLLEDYRELGGVAQHFRHFCLITNLSRLVRSQVTKSKSKTFICDRCLNHFRHEYSFSSHKENCMEISKCRMILPKKGKNIKQFANYKNKERVPFVAYADIECLLIKTDEKKTNTAEYYQHHVPFCVASFIKCSYDDNLSRYELHRGKDCIKYFMQSMKSLATEVHNIIKSPKDMRLTPQEKRDYLAATVCHICLKELKVDRVRDHCHLTGKFRGAAHAGCNLQYQDSRTIPVVFHNFSGYDSHFLIQDLAHEIEGEIGLLPINKENYIAVTKRPKGLMIRLRFIDSFRFMASSLDKLSSYLDDSRKIITRQHYPDANKFRLVTKKGVCPYDFMDDWSKLEQSQLPSRDEFFSMLNNEQISESNYQHAQDVWDEFEIQTIQQYIELYLKTDVLLLADVVESFRDTCLETYNLDPMHYYTAPGLAYDAMLKITGIELELFTDEQADMMLFVEKSIRGGITQCVTRHAKANNPFMGQDFNPEEPISYIQYYDVNNLYGAAMSEVLPYGGYEWRHDITLENLEAEILSTANDASEGYMLEVDLEYPKELHNLHSDFPLAPESLIPPNGKIKKLMTTLYSKEKYILHYTNLKLYVSLGLRVTKVHRVLKFKQSFWLKQYIDLNTAKRTASTNDFEKNFYKLMVNSVFGKTMQNVRNHRNISLVQKWSGRYGARSLIAKPNYHSCLVMDENLVLIELNKTHVNMNIPIIVGACILDISKNFMYDFFYNYVQKEFPGGKAQLLYTDTDSLIIKFNVDNIYEDMKRQIHRFDTSDYPVDNAYGMPRVNKKQLGKMKDENHGLIMTEFVGLRAKLYAYQVQGKGTEKKAKGVKKSTIREIQFQDFINCLNNHCRIRKTQNLIVHNKHQVYTMRQEKVALSHADDKRQLLPNSHDTLPWGYIESMNQQE